MRVLILVIVSFDKPEYYDMLQVWKEKVRGRSDVWFIQCKPDAEWIGDIVNDIGAEACFARRTRSSPKIEIFFCIFMKRIKPTKLEYLQNLLSKVNGAYLSWNWGDKTGLPENRIETPEYPDTGNGNTIIKW